MSQFFRFEKGQDILKNLLRKIQQYLPLPLFSSFLTAMIFLMAALAIAFYTQNYSKDVSYKKLPTSFLKPSPSPIPDPPLFKEIIGFLPSWTAIDKAQVDSANLTQIIFFGLGVNKQGELIKYDEKNNQVYEWTYFTSGEFTKLQKEVAKKGTKIIVAIKNFDNENIDHLISNQTYTDTFIKQLTELVNKFQLDGLNLDFEYVTDSSFPTSRYFNKFLNTLRLNLKKDHPNLIISIDVNASAIETDRAYDLVKIGNEVDQIIVMGYDFARTDASHAGPVAPLYAKNNNHSIDRAIQSLKGRVPMDKVILAIPFYGYEWQTINTDFSSPTIENSGVLATYERINDLINNRQADIEVNWDETSQTPWLVYIQNGAIKQIYYDNARSIAKKLEYIKEMKLAGVAIWALGYEGQSANPWEVIAGFR